MNRKDVFDEKTRLQHIRRYKELEYAERIPILCEAVDVAIDREIWLDDAIILTMGE